MPGDGEGSLLRLVPYVVTASEIPPWLKLHLLIRQNAKCRNAVVPKILVLIVTPDDDEVRLETIKLCTDDAELFNQLTAVLIGMCLASIVAPLCAHTSWPIFGVAQ